jgi:hypothetical protein
MAPLVGRRGGVMVLALVALAVAAAIAATVLRSALVVRRALRTEHHLRQVERLLVAGAAEARARFDAGEPVAGERVLASSDVVGSGSARLTTTVTSPEVPTATLVVEYPLEGPLTIRRSRTVVLSPESVPNSEEPTP